MPQLEMSYPGRADAYTASVLVFERGQCTLEDYLRTQRPSYFQQVRQHGGVGQACTLHRVSALCSGCHPLPDGNIVEGVCCIPQKNSRVPFGLLKQLC